MATSLTRLLISPHNATFPPQGITDVLLEKFKEKNAAVPKAASEALSLMHKHCWRLMDVSEDLAGVEGQCGGWAVRED